jgi:hypothetical protein
LKIELDKPLVNGELIIQDLQGKTIETIRLSGKETLVKTTNYKSGTYLITIMDGSKVINTSKFVVNN